MAITHKLFLFLFPFIFLAATPSQALAQQQKDPLPGGPPKKLTLVEAAMSEGVKDQSPLNPAVVFSAEMGRVHCFTAFDPVPEKTFIYHKWYFRDKLRARVKLTLQPPRWSTLSRFRLREGDKGPWRVEITDQNENILRVLRFSIAD